MFRKIEIDLEDMECEGLESILVDWQGGFLGEPAPTSLQLENNCFLMFIYQYHRNLKITVRTVYAVRCKFFCEKFDSDRISVDDYLG